MSFQNRGFTSLLLTFSFLGATVSGLVLYVAPRGRTAMDVDWSILGLTLYQWTAVHINTCLLLLIVSALHLYLNWTMFKDYLKKSFVGGWRIRQETLLAVLFAGWVTIGACFNLQPFRAITDARYRLKSHWEEPVLQAPVSERENEEAD